MATQQFWPLRIALCVFAVLAQVLIAPYIAIGSALPNILSIAALSFAVATPMISSFGLAFGLGLAFDLLGGGPVGAMAFSLVIVNGLLMFIYRRLGNDTFFMGYLLLVVGLLLSEFIYGLLLLGFGFQASLGSVLVWKVLPNTLYNALLGLGVFWLVNHFVQKMSSSSSIPTASVGVGGL